MSEEVKKLLEMQAELGYTDTYLVEKANVSQTFIHRLKTSKKGIDKPFIEYDLLKIKRLIEVLEIDKNMGNKGSEFNNNHVHKIQVLFHYEIFEIYN